MKRFAGVAVLFVLLTINLILYGRITIGELIISIIVSIIIAVVSSMYFFGPEEGFK